MKNVDNIVLSYYTFLYFCIAVAIDGNLKTYKIMKHVVKKQVKFVFPNPVDYYCDNVKNMVHFVLDSLAVNPDNYQCFQNGVKTVDQCLEEVDKLRSYLLIFKDIIDDETPLPF